MLIVTRMYIFVIVYNTLDNSEPRNVSSTIYKQRDTFYLYFVTAFFLIINHLAWYYCYDMNRFLYNYVLRNCMIQSLNIRAMFRGFSKSIQFLYDIFYTTYNEAISMRGESWVKLALDFGDFIIYCIIYRAFWEFRL